MPGNSTIIVSGVIVATVLTALVDQDRRGLFFYTEPEIFAVEEVEDTPEPTSFPVVWGAPLGEQVETSPVRRRPDRARNRQRSTQPTQSFVSNFENPSPIDSSAQSAEPVQFAEAPIPPALDSPLGEGPAQAQSLSSQTNASQPTQTASTPPPAPPASQPIVTGVTPISVPSGTGPTGGPTIVLPPSDPLTGEMDPIDPIDDEGDNVDSVVPAVPEPASWLMMILGVGALGLMLRYRREEFDLDPQTV